MKRDCRAPKKNNGSAKESVNVAEDTGDALILSVNSLVESWILDYGASYHYTSHYEIMENYINGDFGKVYLVDDGTMKIMRKDDIQVKRPNGTVWKLKDMRFVPSLKRNLISMDQPNQEGHHTTFLRNEWKITKETIVITHGKKNGTLYVTSNMENIVAIVESYEK